MRRSRRKAGEGRKGRKKWRAGEKWVAGPHWPAGAVPQDVNSPCAGNRSGHECYRSPSAHARTLQKGDTIQVSELTLDGVGLSQEGVTPKRKSKGQASHSLQQNSTQAFLSSGSDFIGHSRHLSEIRCVMLIPFFRFAGQTPKGESVCQSSLTERRKEPGPAMAGGSPARPTQKGRRLLAKGHKSCVRVAGRPGTSIFWDICRKS